MLDGHRVAAFTPYGREVTVRILFEYLEREHQKGVLDEWMLCMNTDQDQVSDREYAHAIAKKHKWINLYERPGPDTPEEVPIPEVWRSGYREPKQMNTMRFYWYMQDRDTIYCRFDDDIVWMHPDALSNMVHAKIHNPNWLATFPVIWNNAICSWFMQRFHVLPLEWGVVQPNAVDHVGWKDPLFAIGVHERLLGAIEDNEVEALINPIWAQTQELGYRQQFSVSAFAISGNEYADLGGVLNWDEEEHWLTMHQPGVASRANWIIGNAHVSHLTFFTNREIILSRTDILRRYQRLATNL